MTLADKKEIVRMNWPAPRHEALYDRRTYDGEVTEGGNWMLESEENTQIKEPFKRTRGFEVLLLRLPNFRKLSRR